MNENNSEPATPQTETPANPTPTPTPVAGPVPVAPSAPGQGKGLAIAALIVGIVAFLSGWAPFWGVIVGIVAVVLGIIALKKADGKGMAIAGLVTGAIGALWSIVVTIIFMLALLAGTAAVSQIQEAAEKADEKTNSLIDSKKDFAKGETANFGGDYEVKVTGVETNHSPSSYHLPEDGNQFVKVFVSVRNISDESQYLTPMSFDLLDNGLAKTATYVSNDGQLESGNIAAGATVEGALIYEVSADATGLKLTYEKIVYGLTLEEGSKKLTYTLAI